MNEADVRSRVQRLMSEINPDEPGVQHLDFLRAKFDHGLGWCHFPEGYGGLGVSAKLQAVIEEEVHTHSKKYVNPFYANLIGHGMGAPVVLTYATEEQKKSWLRPLYTNEDIWCQMFSEPSAGSDVAGLSMRAERDGDDYVINGQKVWTTLAHLANWGMLVARTNPDVPKHDGLSYFIVDMKSPGIEVRPLYQITAEAEFNEVFFNDVRVPAAQRLGKEGQGWQVAITTLMNERVAIGAANPRRDTGPARTLRELYNERAAAHTPAKRATLRDKVLDLETRYRLMTLTGQRGKAAQKSGNPGPEGSVVKLAQAELQKKIWDTSLDVLGADALTFEEGYELRRPEASPPRSGLDAQAKYNFLRSRANSIEGGTSEIMRNILGERVLGLPGEPRVDKDVPWKDVPRGS